MISENTFGSIYPLAEFLTSLTTAARGVLRVDIRNGDTADSVCTGWLITDDLVVIPHYAPGQDGAESADRYLCSTENTELVPAELIYRSGSADLAGSALLRLSVALPGRALRLDVDGPQPGQPIFVVQYPHGDRQASVSQGQILAVNPRVIRHNAPTMSGSGGAPVMAIAPPAVIGMHMGETRTGDERSNQAVLVAEILRELRSSASWDEIARHHRLADVGAAYRELARAADAEQEAAAEGGHRDLLAAALRWSVDPAELDPGVSDRLRPLVGDPDEPAWSMLGDERRRLIKAAGSLAELQIVHVPSGGHEPGQRTIDQIVAGPPFDLARVGDEDLPYWLQAVGWFADVVPGLPSPAEVYRTLERRRLRGRLSGVAAPKLWGREAELARLRRWYGDLAAGPMAVTGVGGVGKSALIAQFALGLLADTVLLWLDFDRADLAPDDAVSVLRSLGEQLAVQVDDFVAPPVDGSAWGQGADDLGHTLAGAVTADQAPLLVLDGFEVAQHVHRHEEIWGVLERILARVPALRIVVSGRAPVPGLSLAGRAGDTLHLEGLTDAAARVWLIDRDIAEPAVLDAILRLADGVPLLLKMAVRLVETGGAISAVPEALPRLLIEGYLYQRILDRVVDRALRPLARDALQLRRLSADMIPLVLGDRLPAGLDAPAVYARLSRELAFVEALDERPPDAAAGPDPGSLRLRPEVRVATLRLLELDNVRRVREIDRRAAAWYAGQNQSDVAVATELVYHHLRLGEVGEAERAWRDECAPLLRDAEEDIPAEFEPARAWLRDRIGGTGGPDALTDWEQQTYGRIRSALNRGLVRVVPSILGERPERSTGSPLSAYDAWVRWRIGGDLEGARSDLAAAVPAPGPTGRERALLGARVGAEAGERSAADTLLAPLDDPAAWSDWVWQGQEASVTTALAVRAARIRLTVDLQAELSLTVALERDKAGVLYQVLSEVLTPADAVLPSLSRALARESESSSSYRMPLVIPEQPDGLERFANNLDRERITNTVSPGPSPVLFVGRANNPRPYPVEAWTASELRLEPNMFGQLPSGLEPYAALGFRLAVLAHRRWSVAANTTFLAEALDPLVSDAILDELRFAVLCTVSAFRGQPLSYGKRRQSLDAALQYVIKRYSLPDGPDRRTARSALVVAIIQREGYPDLLQTLEMSGLDQSGYVDWFVLPADGWSSGFNSLMLYLLGPDPLDILYRRVLAVAKEA